MKTRTLLLLSVGMALMILVAGGALLFQLSNQDESVVPNELGEEVRVGDMSAVVVEVQLVGDILSTTVEVGGVDDPDGASSFGVLAGGAALAPTAGDEADRCDAITVEVSTCRLEFDLSTSTGTKALLVLTRGEERATWSLPISQS